MKLKKKPYILIVGSGVLGAYLSKLLLKKNYNTVVTTRKTRKNFINYEKLKISKKVKFKKLNVQKEKEIEKIINTYNPIHIYYFAGVSSIAKSFKLSKEIQISNYLGAKKFLEVIYKHKFNIKFFKANSGYIFQNNNNKCIKHESLFLHLSIYFDVFAYLLLQHKFIHNRIEILSYLF